MLSKGELLNILALVAKFASTVVWLKVILMFLVKIIKTGWVEEVTSRLAREYLRNKAFLWMLPFLTRSYFITWMSCFGMGWGFQMMFRKIRDHSLQFVASYTGNLNRGPEECGVAWAIWCMAQPGTHMGYRENWFPQGLMGFGHMHLTPCTIYIPGLWNNFLMQKCLINLI